MNLPEFFSMGGRGFYVWGSYGAFAIAIVLEIVFARLRAKRVHAEIREELMTDMTKGRAQ